ncbi:hypothetical protein QLH51_15910 [Sphingomonas sp. 2R-10]|nr:hypothetical protein [Sphingomonas sp. 2R-10]MDJ0278285.1 hypothetical protein [Sphingomonas sp. 2R-10]
MTNLLVTADLFEASAEVSNRTNASPYPGEGRVQLERLFRILPMPPN